MIQISPSILSADFANLERDLNRISQADMIHIDVMDGQFVPNISMGIPVLASINKVTTLPLDVHLMIVSPERYIEDFIKAGATRITVHIESDTPEKIQQVFDLCDKHGVEKGLALRPMTCLAPCIPYLKQLHQLLIMTVEPGFGGQSFMEEQVAVIEEAHKILQKENPSCQIQVDGGINLNTAPLVKKAGATILVAGSAVYGCEDPNQAIAHLKSV